ncbi:NAD(P)H-dependent glycerol-3-phosphate dehydrogenase [Sulfurimonas sp.]|uniref:NAD(P)H-dependent glycerol-3-phosphate dehydrogenase n=1 Tax=Sulfurimonas sp. TaxID=2022749 RepID=UPI0026229396|nr:NAD(P)H-dependent glycerol-3-phosphate dehydrogenase [Sulfurimonas sp.]MCW8894292.1 NAD(P)H-dependent glycerol-3-phosphate dehydrogenase [Sulfurimonas sp.]MCW9067580.1 NAD(P)H-dependent glycerol-3-phosphate dehydrogenase [Sulfurimonas sp.]
MNKIGVIGAGKWGLALAFALSEKNEVFISSRTSRDMRNFISMQEILKFDYLVIAIPAQQVASWLEEHFIFSHQKVLVAAKGIEASSGRFLNEIYAKHIPSSHIAFLSGPSFATEVMKSLPTALVVNSENEELSAEFASFFPSFIKTYTSTDVVGAEVAGAYKNVIAIAAGICDGLGLGKNAAASLISRGLVEMQRFGCEYGAKEESFVGLSGAGDLFLTASSTMSRNFRVGQGIAAGKSKEEILKELGEVAEGIGTTYALKKIADERDLYLPIAREVYNMLEGENPHVSLKNFLAS